MPEGGQTLVYSTVGDHEIKLDYYLPPKANGTLPIVIYYHGGGMTAGSRRDGQFPRWLYDHCQGKGYIFVSADYRLCHPCTALDQIDDAKSLFKFLTGEDFAKALPGSVSIDTARIVVTGFSAGAYSARAACVYSEPKPAALLTGFGTGGNWLLDHWTQARPPTTIAKFVDLDRVPKILADNTVISDDFVEGKASTGRFALTVRWELDGTFLDGSLGRPGLGAQLDVLDYSQRATALPEDLKPAFVQLFVTKDYPPSVFVHGTADEVVLPQESVDHYEQLKELGVKTELYLVKDGPHGLYKFGSGPWEGSVEAYEKALEFVDEVLKSVE
ncbi:Alpha/Beta hydrolase protein [Ilyonectria robusta]|uniref:Alpha/Beta hydrolase protein n=1 Tax=Ilyonectria robusta TaxID=1079257 RepID=UPI001E8E7649|nr:Alpha/Beta hydrolase protein [Ilyonectria robusta]KAH8685081.1 Alpha/Beta hydrolase protein [Ilyonectria robusta]